MQSLMTKEIHGIYRFLNMRLAKQCMVTFTITWRKTEFPGRDGGILRTLVPINGWTVNGWGTFVTQRGPSAIWNHCMNHREQLASIELSVPIRDILQQVVTMVNDIKQHPLRAES